MLLEQWDFAGWVQPGEGQDTWGSWVPCGGFVPSDCRPQAVDSRPALVLAILWPVSKCLSPDSLRGVCPQGAPSRSGHRARCQLEPSCCSGGPGAEQALASPASLSDGQHASPHVASAAGSGGARCPGLQPAAGPHVGAGRGPGPSEAVW